VKPAILRFFDIVDATRKLGNAIGVGGELAGGISGAVHGFGDLLGGRARITSFGRCH
jgi:hypothetical protein